MKSPVYGIHNFSHLSTIADIHKGNIVPVQLGAQIKIGAIAHRDNQHLKRGESFLISKPSLDQRGTVRINGKYFLTGQSFYAQLVQTPQQLPPLHRQKIGGKFVSHFENGGLCSAGG